MIQGEDLDALKTKLKLIKLFMIHPPGFQTIRYLTTGSRRRHLTP